MRVSGHHLTKLNVTLAHLQERHSCAHRGSFILFFLARCWMGNVCICKSGSDMVFAHVDLGEEG